MDAEYYKKLEEVIEAEIRRLEKIIINGTDLIEHLRESLENVQTKRELIEHGIDPETGVRMIKFSEWKNIQDLG